MVPKIEWLGHASFRIIADRGTIYIDPWKVSTGPKADLILVTHSHHDHMCMDDIVRLSGPDTRVVGPADVASKIKRSYELRPRMYLEFPVKGRAGPIKVEGYNAYNPKKRFHPMENGWLGLVVDLGGYRIYHSGDTDVIPEMEGIKDIDVALLPVGGTYTMTAKEAVEAVKVIRPKKAIPMHWGDIVGGRADAELFKKLCPCDVEILEQVR